MRAALVIAALTAAQVFGAAQASELGGEWARGDGKARVRVEPCGSDLCATNIWIKPGTPRERQGDRLVMSIRERGEGHYSGTAFDTRRNRTYRLTVTIDGDRLTTKGCLAGVICRSIGWTRIE